MTYPRNITLIAPAMQSGKSTVATCLNVRYGYEIVPFARPMKLMVRTLLEAFGIDRKGAEYLLSTGKEDRIGCIPGMPTARHLLQTIGTEWGRDCIHQGLWLCAWAELASQHEHVVVDDCRFLNEYALLRESPVTQIWRITRPSATITTAHASEGQLDNVPVDAEIVNDGTLQDLFRKVDLLMEAMP
jgi:hypothetical protein